MVTKYIKTAHTEQVTEKVQEAEKIIIPGAAWESHFTGEINDFFAHEEPNKLFFLCVQITHLL